MSGIENFLNLLGSGEAVSDRDTALTTKVKKTTIDTCLAYDTGKWETAIDRGDGVWKAVEQYENKTKAKAGHKKWVKKIKNNSKIDFEKLDKEVFKDWVA